MSCKNFEKNFFSVGRRNQSAFLSIGGGVTTTAQNNSWKMCSR